jgi:hypothetical protein
VRPAQHPLARASILGSAFVLLWACGAPPHRQPIGPGEEQHVGFVGGDDDKPPAPPAASEQPEAPDVDVTAPIDPVPAAELIEAGEEPLMPLDYHLRTGQRERLELRIAYLLRARARGRRLPPRHYDFRLTFDFGPVQPTRDRYRIPYRVVAAVAPPAENSPEDLRGAVTDIAREIVATHGLLIMDVRGRVLGVSLEAPDAVSPVTLSFTDQLQALLRELPVQLPEEPIGVGGSWRLHQEVNSPMRVQGDVVMTLTSLDGDNAAYRALGEFVMPAQPVPGVAGALFRRSQMRVMGQGHLNLGAIAQQSQSHGRLSAEASAEGASPSRRLRLDLAISSSTTPMLEPEAGSEAGGEAF